MMFIGLGVFLGQFTNGQGGRLWCDILPQSREDALRGVPTRHGMGMVVAMDDTGFPWFMDKLAWDRMIFKPELSGRMGFRSLNLQERLRHGKFAFHSVRDFSATIEGCSPWLLSYGRLRVCRDLLYRLFFQACAQQFRRDILFRMKSSIRTELHEDVESGAIAFSYDSMVRIFIRGRRAIYVKHNVRDKIKTWHQWCRAAYLDPASTIRRQRPYLIPFISARETISRALGPGASLSWQKQYFEYLRQTHWLVPYPQNKMLPSQNSETKRGAKRPWQMYAHYNSTMARDRTPDWRLPVDWHTLYSDSWEDHTNRDATLLLSRHDLTLLQACSVARHPLMSIF